MPQHNEQFKLAVVQCYAMGERMPQALTAQALGALVHNKLPSHNRQRRHSRLGNVPSALFAKKFSKQPQEV